MVTQNKKERFSTNYKTEEEFCLDREKILNYLEKQQKVPTELLEKVTHTVKELELYIF